VPGQQRCLAQFGEFVLVGYFFGATAYDHAPADLVGFVDAIHLERDRGTAECGGEFVRITILSSSRR
jgi:hypothetical protein